MIHVLTAWGQEIWCSGWLSPGSAAPSPLWPARSGGSEGGCRTDWTTTPSARPPCTSPAGTTVFVWSSCGRWKVQARGVASYIRRRWWWRCVISTWLCICDACLACCVSRVSAITEYRQLPASCRPDFLYFVWKKQTLGQVLGRHFKFFKLKHQVATWTPCPQFNSIIIFVSQDTASYIHKWCRELLD